MFYEDLYKVLGGLFYHTAAVDGTVHASEKEKLHQLVQKNWKPVEQSTDEFGTDQASQIEFAFDFEESETINHSGLADFELFYKQHKPAFTPLIKDNILRTIYAVSSAFHGENKKEEALFYRVKNLLEN